jgi:crotonobetaine/carnitine-CoA ligase
MELSEKNDAFKEKARVYYRRAWLLWRVLRAIALFVKARGLSLAVEMSHADLLEEKAARLGDTPFLMFRDRVFTYRQMDENANRLANWLKSMGGDRGVGVAILMKNSPRWLDVFFGLEKLGMYTVPVNVALREDQLAFILDNSEARILVVDHDLLQYYQSIADKVPRIEKVIVNLEGAPADFGLREGMSDLAEAYAPGASATRPAGTFDPDDICIIMYTSGTTGLPKGVVSRYRGTNVKALAIMTRIISRKGEVSYTCYPLFHANALFLTVTTSLHSEGRVALGEKFSASRFWDDTRRYGATTFNGLGAVMPILMKQPPRPDDADNPVRVVISSGCPADIWREFEQRFGLEIFEGYGAVDGGSVLITNFGTAPVGSMGKPLGAKIKLVDGDGNEVSARTPGELICYVGNKKGSVEYFKNPDATSDKVRGEWLYTGDLCYLDEKGYVYFVGRNTESMRHRGENVSALEVETAMMQHPDILECAVFAVPSDLAEDDIMATVVPMDGRDLDPASLPAFLNGRIAKFAVPRYYRVMSALPKTETHRVIKKELERAGVTEDTYDAEASN